MDATILLLGGRGQLGSALLKRLRKVGKIVATTHNDNDLGPSLNFLKPAAVKEFVNRLRPHLVINAVAYTGVDAAEKERAAAWTINTDTVWELASVLAKLDIPLIHFSTDYVFSGKRRTPYKEYHFADPVNHYGITKLAGEEAIRTASCNHLIIRTSWLYGPNGKNFFTAICDKVRNSEPLLVVDDQIGQPTSVGSLADQVISWLRGNDFHRLINECSGTYHVSAGGACSWYDFAKRIVAKSPIPHTHVKNITSDSMKKAARRPAYSVLDTSKAHNILGVTLEHWSRDVDRIIGNFYSSKLG